METNLTPANNSAPRNPLNHGDSTHHSSSRTSVSQSLDSFDDDVKTLHDRAEDEFSLWDLLLTLGLKKRFVFGIPLVLMIATAVYSLQVVPIFTARTLIMPPQQASGGSAILDQLGPLAGAAAGAMGIKSPTDTYVTLFKSQSVRDMIIDRFDLKERYRSKNLTEAREAIAKRIRVTGDKLSGTVTIEVNERDPKMAADIANAHLDAIRELLGKFSSTDARNRRLFFQQQVDQFAEKPFRDLRIQEMVVAAMIKQYEMARIDEAKGGPTVQQVDVAVPPDVRSYPSRTAMVLISGMFGLIAGVCVALALKKIESSRADPDLVAKWSGIKQAWLSVR